MATTKQRQAARRNVKKAQKAARSKKSIAHMPKKTRTALGKQAAAVAKRKRTGGTHPKTKSELMKIAQKRGLEGRTKYSQPSDVLAQHRSVIRHRAVRFRRNTLPLFRARPPFVAELRL